MNQTHQQVSSAAGLPWPQLLLFMVAAGLAVYSLVVGLESLFGPNQIFSLFWLGLVCLSGWVMFAQARNV